MGGSWLGRGKEMLSFPIASVRQSIFKRKQHGLLARDLT